MSWMIDGGPDGYQTGSGFPRGGEIPHEGSAIKMRADEKSGYYLKNGNTQLLNSAQEKTPKERLESILTEFTNDIDPENEVRNARYYQEVTFRKLHELILKEAEKGNSKFMTNSLSFGDSMINYLKNKGFKHNYGVNSSWHVLSW